MAKQTKNNDAVARVQLLVNARAHGACEALVDAAIARLLASKKPVNVKSLVADVGADVQRVTGIVIPHAKLVADVAYATGIDAKPGKQARIGAASVQAGKLVAYKPRSSRSDAAREAIALNATAKPTHKPAKPTKPGKPVAKPVTDATDNG